MASKNSFLQNTESYFDKLMTQRYVSKAEIMALKQSFKKLKGEVPNTYNHCLNRVTTVVNKVKGKNSPDELKSLYDEFKLLVNPPE
jgi:hypothetical protein